VSTRRTDWHVAEQDLADYLIGTGVVQAASIEAHLLGCDACRDRLAHLDGDTERDRAWLQLADLIDRPSPTLLSRVSLGHRVVRSSVATPLMVQAAVLSVLVVGLIPLGTALLVGDAGLVALLVLAPLAPVAAVALAYRDWTDPAGEISLATPSAGLRLVALRALLVSGAAVPLAFVALLAVDIWVEDVQLQLAAAWCLPGLALAALVLLAGTTKVDPLHVAVAVSAGWAVAVMTAATVRRSLRPEIFIDIISSPAMQSAALVVAFGALFLTVVRRDAVAYRRTA
jgi:hypothetical protein